MRRENLNVHLARHGAPQAFLQSATREEARAAARLLDAAFCERKRILGRRLHWFVSKKGNKKGEWIATRIMQNSEEPLTWKFRPLHPP